MQPLFIPVILGTTRKGRRSENAARFVFEETKKRAGVETEFVDICKIPMRLDDAGEQVKDQAFSDLVKLADGLILVVPEYNHGYLGLLKHALRHESGGIHSQGGRDLRSVGGSIWWRA